MVEHPWCTWTCGGVAHSQKAASKRVRYWSQTQTVDRLSGRHHTVLVMFRRFRKPLYSCTEGLCRSSTRLGTSLHVTQFYQAFSRVSTASDKRWSEKAWVRDYRSTTTQAVRMHYIGWKNKSDISCLNIRITVGSSNISIHSRALLAAILSRLAGLYVSQVAAP